MKKIRFSSSFLSYFKGFQNFCEISQNALIFFAVSTMIFLTAENTAVNLRRILKEQTEFT